MAAERTLTLPTNTDVWPSLPLEAWRDTYATLHMWMQVIGKIRLALAPMVSHWWQVTLYVTSRGLTTSPIPYGTRIFQIDFDFLDHKLLIQTADGGTRSLPLAPRSVAEFYRSEEHTSELQSRLHLVCRLLLEKKKKKHIVDTTT